MMISFGPAVDNKDLRDKKRWDQLTRTLGTGEDDMLQEAWREYRVQLRDFFTFKLRDFLDEDIGLGKGQIVHMEDMHFGKSHHVSLPGFNTSWVYYCGDCFLYGTFYLKEEHERNTTIIGTWYEIAIFLSFPYYYLPSQVPTYFTQHCSELLNLSQHPSSSPKLIHLPVTSLNITQLRPTAPNLNKHHPAFLEI